MQPPGAAYEASLSTLPRWLGLLRPPQEEERRSVTTNRGGEASFTFSSALSAGQVVTGIATAAGGSTSELSRARKVKVG